MWKLVIKIAVAILTLAAFAGLVLAFSVHFAKSEDLILEQKESTIQRQQQTIDRYKALSTFQTKEEPPSPAELEIIKQEEQTLIELKEDKIRFQEKIKK